MEPFRAAPHGDILMLMVQIAVLLMAARALGEVSRRMGQPTVVGEILAGILLGPSLLSSTFPEFGQWIVPQTPVQGYLLEVISLVGAMFMMLITGLETDLALIRRHARTVLGVSLSGIAVTFTGGFLLGMRLPDILLGNPDERTIFALFLGTAMAISAIAVIAKVIMDLNLMRRDIGQSLIAAGMSDDTIGWILLSIVAGLVAGQRLTVGSVAYNAGVVLAFIILSLTLGLWLMKRLVDFVGDRLTGSDRYLTLIVVMMFAWGAISQAIHLEAVLGAFVIGIVFNQIRRLPEDALDKIESIGLGVFAPIFFAVAGLKVNLASLMQPRLLGLALVVIGVTALAKGTGTYLGARLIGRKDHWYALSFSAGLNTRGAMDIIIATIGLSLGVFSPDMFSIIVLMAMTNALIAPTVLRWVLRHVTPSDEELARLEQEEKAEGSFVAGIHRVLLPVRLRDTSTMTYRIEARILEKFAAKSPIELTLLTITKPGERAKGIDFLDRISGLFTHVTLTKRVVEGTAPSELILDQAAKGYELMVLGASEELGSSRVLFNPMIDYLVRVSPCPTMIIRGGSNSSEWSGSRILVPTNGSLASRRAAEVGFALAQEEGEKVILLNVVQKHKHHLSFDPDGSLFQRQLGAAHHIVEDLKELGATMAAAIDDEVRVGRDPERVILDLAKKAQVDLIVLGTDLRPGSERLFLGPKVERILNEAPCPVAVLNAM
jgi:Kef-type K+ transport system membrane component KefB